MTLRLGEIVIDCADHEVVVPFWLAALGDYQRLDVNEQYVAIAPLDRAADRPPILFQKVPEPKVAKNRVHMDLRGPSMAEEVERLQGLGATFIAERSLGRERRVVRDGRPRGQRVLHLDRSPAAGRGLALPDRAAGVPPRRWFAGEAATDNREVMLVPVGRCPATRIAVPAGSP